MKAPLVSVHMLTYNHAPYIGKAIEGVLNQKTRYPIELLIGEDCSTDGTRKIVFDYQKRYPDTIRIITSESNVGLKKNNYRTVKACRGKYIAFCEGDDYWHNPLKIEKQITYLENHKKCGLVFSSYDVYHDRSKQLVRDFIKFRSWKIPKFPNICDIISGNTGILTCTVTIRKCLYVRIVEADPYLHQSEHFLMGDTQVWAEAAALASIHYMPESLATHVITEESATRSKDVRKRLIFRISNAELHIWLSEKYNLPSSIRARGREYLWYCLLRLAAYTKNRKMAEEVLREKQHFIFKDWLLYYSSSNILLHYAYRLRSFCREVACRKEEVWS